jgi:hypothetical protein
MAHDGANRPNVPPHDSLELRAVLPPRKSVKQPPHSFAVGCHDAQRANLAWSQRKWASPGVLNPHHLTEEVMELDRGHDAFDALGRLVRDERVDDTMISRRTTLATPLQVAMASLLNDLIHQHQRLPLQLLL